MRVWIIKSWCDINLLLRWVFKLILSLWLADNRQKAIWLAERAFQSASIWNPFWVTRPSSFRNIEKRFGKLIKKYQRTKIIALVGLMQDARISKTMLMSYSNLEELEMKRKNSIVSTKQGEFLSRKIKSKESFQSYYDILWAISYGHYHMALCVFVSNIAGLWNIDI